MYRSADMQDSHHPQFPRLRLSNFSGHPATRSSERRSTGVRTPDAVCAAPIPFVIVLKLTVAVFDHQVALKLGQNLCSNSNLILPDIKYPYRLSNPCLVHLGPLVGVECKGDGINPDIHSVL